MIRVFRFYAPKRPNTTNYQMSRLRKRFHRPLIRLSVPEGMEPVDFSTGGMPGGKVRTTVVTITRGGMFGSLLLGFSLRRKAAKFPVN